jgi:hypothetical protein
MKKITLTKTIPEGGLCPKYYGVSWFVFDQYNIRHRQYICHPFPFNIAISLLRRAFLYIRYGDFSISKKDRMSFRMKSLEKEIIDLKKENTNAKNMIFRMLNERMRS